MFQKVAKPSCENAAWGDYFLLEIQSRILESANSESAKAICLPSPGPITTFDVQSQLKKYVWNEWKHTSRSLHSVVIKLPTYSPDQNAIIF